MKFSSAAASLLLSTTMVSAFRDQSTKKDPNRRLQDLECTVNHDLAKSPTELSIHVQGFPSDADALFDITMHGPPYAEEGRHVTIPGWCIDYDRPIETGDYMMDVFSAFDPDIHTDALDKPEFLPNVVWMVNNINVGDRWPKSDSCEGGKVTWFELQGAIWKVIDDNHGQGTPYQTLRVECITDEIAALALKEGNDYEPDCTDPNEIIPLVFVVDEDDKTKDTYGDILNQVIMSETPLSSIEGMCECRERTPSPSASPTASPTESPTASPTESPTASPTKAPTDSPTSPPEDGTDRNADDDFEKEEKTPAPTTSAPASSSGDPHFKTFSGDKFDYHGECDLVLIDNPSFADGLGMRLHVRTTRVKYFSYIEEVALQIGDEVLQFNNDVENFLLNGKVVEENRKHHKTYLSGYMVRRDQKAISVRLDKESKAKIDFISRKNGFPAVRVDAGDRTDMFEGSLGLLGEGSTGKRMARDGLTEMNDEDATAFALEWQVRDTEPMLFQTARFPQFPTTCTPPQKILGGRLGRSHMEKEAEQACAHWEEDKEDCIFDVIATRDVLVAEEGHISLHAIDE